MDVGIILFFNMKESHSEMQRVANGSTILACANATTCFCSQPCRRLRLVKFALELILAFVRWLFCFVKLVM